MNNGLYFIVGGLCAMVVIVLVFGGHFHHGFHHNLDHPRVEMDHRP